MVAKCSKFIQICCLLLRCFDAKLSSSCMDQLWQDASISPAFTHWSYGRRQPNHCFQQKNSEHLLLTTGPESRMTVIGIRLSRGHCLRSSLRSMPKMTWTPSWSGGQLQHEVSPVPSCLLGVATKGSERGSDQHLSSIGALEEPKNTWHHPLHTL